jgi:hypothetical protein
MINMATDLRCGQIRRLLPLVAGDAEGSDLPWDERRLVERHLIGCASCRAHRDSMTMALAALHLAASVPPISADTPSVWPALSRQIRGTRHPHPARWFGLGFGGSVGLAASLLLLGTAIGLLTSRLGALSPPQPAPTVVVEAPPEPRPAIPDGQPQLLAGQPTPAPKPEPRAALDIDAKGAASRLRDPQRSQ